MFCGESSRGLDVRHGNFREPGGGSGHWAALGRIRADRSRQLRFQARLYLVSFISVILDYCRYSLCSMYACLRTFTRNHLLQPCPKDSVASRLSPFSCSHILSPILSRVRQSCGGWIDIFRFKDDILFFEFRSRTTVWPRATQMDVDAAKALALRINMEVEVRKGPPYLPAAETPFKDAETISSSTSKCSLLTTSRTGPRKCVLSMTSAEL